MEKGKKKTLHYLPEDLCEPREMTFFFLWLKKPEKSVKLDSVC